MDNPPLPRTGSSDLRTTDLHTTSSSSRTLHKSNSTSSSQFRRSASKSSSQPSRNLSASDRTRTRANTYTGNSAPHNSAYYSSDFTAPTEEGASGDRFTQQPISDRYTSRNLPHTESLNSHGTASFIPYNTPPDSYNTTNSASASSSTPSKSSYSPINLNQPSSVFSTPKASSANPTNSAAYTSGDVLLASPLYQLEIQMAQARTTTKGSSKFPLGGPTSPSGSPPSPSSPSVGKFTSDPITSSYNIDRESIYSFDSVSTNGRLLDRLGFDNEDLFDDDNELTRRDSAISVTSTGNAFERLEIDEHRSKLRSLSKTPSLNKDRYPTGSSASLQNNLAAIRGLSRPSPGTTTGSGSSSHHHHQPSQAQRDSHVSLKHVPMKVVFQTTNNSVDSFKSDMASINKINTSSSTSLQTLVRQNLQNGSSVTMTSSESSSSGSSGSKGSVSSFNTSQTDQNILTMHNGGNKIYTETYNNDQDYNSREYGTRTPLQGNSPTSNVSPDSPETINQFEFSSSNDSINNLPETPNLNSSRYNDIAPTPDTSSLPKARAGIMRTPSAPVVGTVRNDISYDTMESTSANGSPVRRRIISEGSQSSYSNASIGNFSRVESRTPPSSSTSTFSSSSTSNLTPESRTKLAQQLRKIGKHREASYQLQIAANVPNNYPRAMLLYALALRYGNGVKQNDKHSIKWLCKCILIHSSHASIAANISSVMEKLNNLQFEELVRLIIKNLDNTINMDPNKNGTDPVELFDVFSTFTTAQKSRIATISKSQADIVAVSYHELGNALYQGWGLESKDEINGIKCLSKAGSLGYVGAMVALGEIWSTKSKNRKKDLYKAAAWLRLGEIFGVKSMGNSWIYKEKYMPVK